MAVTRFRKIFFLTLLWFDLNSHAINQLTSRGNLFEKIHGKIDDGPSTNSEFHKCSLDQSCLYIVQNKDSKYQRLSVIASLGNYLQVWKKFQRPGYADCKEAKNLGMTTSGVADLRLSASFVVQGYCDMVTDGGGWTLFQRRVDGSVGFNRNWQSYKEGFGDVNGNFWLGLEALHKLTSTGTVTLRIDLKRADGVSGFAEYNNFRILSEAQKYALEFAAYSGNIGDGLGSNRDHQFSTYDNDNDDASWNCAASWKGGWWHNQCFEAMLNNRYYNISDETAATMSWKSDWTNYQFGTIIRSEMKLRRVYP